MPERAVDQTFETYQNVSGFSMEDVTLLASIGPQVRPTLPALTNRFYEKLQADPATGAVIEGRVDALKKTHLQWLNELFAGLAPDVLVARQEMIGRVHVRAKIPPIFVAASMSFLRAAFPGHLASVLEDKQEVANATTAILRTLDVCQYLIDRAYNQCLMDNLGISLGLLNRLMTT